MRRLVAFACWVLIRDSCSATLLGGALKRRINRWLVVAAAMFWATAVFELFARQGI